MNYYDNIATPGKKIALLIDPEKLKVPALIATLYAAQEANVKLIFVGGSLLSERLEATIDIIKKNSDLPVYLFPGSLMQLSKNADCLLLLSMVSGRNPDYLIGNHVLAAPYIKKTNLEVVPTGYILIEGGAYTSVEYISNTRAIPSNKTDLIVATALAAEMLGHKLIYLEAGSGAKKHVPLDAIREVKKHISVPLIVGGGINTEEKAREILKAGADVIVVGTAVEEKIDNLISISKSLKIS